MMIENIVSAKKKKSKLNDTVDVVILPPLIQAATTQTAGTAKRYCDCFMHCKQTS